MVKIFLIFIIICMLNDIYTCCECCKYVSKESEINKNKISETQYLIDNLKDIEKVNKYIYIKNLYSDEVEDISGIRDITTEQILNNLGVNDAQIEIDKCVSINKKVGTIKSLIEEALIELTEEAYKIKESTNLYSKETGAIYDVNQTVRDTDLKNGSRIILL